MALKQYLATDFPGYVKVIPAVPDGDSSTASTIWVLPERVPIMGAMMLLIVITFLTILARLCKHYGPCVLPSGNSSYRPNQSQSRNNNQQQPIRQINSRPRGARDVPLNSPLSSLPSSSTRRPTSENPPAYETLFKESVFKIPGNTEVEQPPSFEEATGAQSSSVVTIDETKK